MHREMLRQRQVASTWIRESPEPRFERGVSGIDKISAVSRLPEFSPSNFGLWNPVSNSQIRPNSQSRRHPPNITRFERFL
jgi:hypothetical protein